MPHMSNDAVCVYCAGAVLIGLEPPEHALPAAIGGRLTTDAVCEPCNTWAGRHIDQPWLDDPFVGHARFMHRIPDRRGGVLEHDPLLAGTTAEGQQIRMDRDGRPVALNSVVQRDEAGGEVRIIAKDQADLDRLLAREAKKAAAAGRTVDVGEGPTTVVDAPHVEGRAKVVPGQWERMAAKATLALLSTTQDPGWRRSGSADILRAVMLDLDRPAHAVRLMPTDDFEPFAAAPASAIVVTPLRGRPTAIASLLCNFSIAFELEDDLAGVDIAWVCDPLDPDRSFTGSMGLVVGRRLGLI